MIHSFDILGYTYEADTWCENCLPVPTDHEEVGAVFENNSSEWDEGFYCNVCHEELILNPHNFILHKNKKTLLVRVDIKWDDITLSYYGATGIKDPTSSLTLEIEGCRDTEDVLSELRDIVYDGAIQEVIKLLKDQYEDEGDFLEVMAEWYRQHEARTRLVAFFGGDEGWLDEL